MGIRWEYVGIRVFPGLFDESGNTWQTVWEALVTSTTYLYHLDLLNFNHSLAQYSILYQCTRYWYPYLVAIVYCIVLYWVLPLLVALLPGTSSSL